MSGSVSFKTRIIYSAKSLIDTCIRIIIVIIDLEVTIIVHIGTYQVAG